MAALFVDVLYHYRRAKQYLLHEFVVMPNHFHLLITPSITLERALQLIKGGFSFRARQQFGAARLLWQTSFYDHRIRDAEEYQRTVHYIRQNPIKAGLVQAAEEFAYSSACSRWELDEVPQRLKPADIAALKQQA